MMYRKDGKPWLSSWSTLNDYAEDLGEITDRADDVEGPEWMTRGRGAGGIAAGRNGNVHIVLAVGKSLYYRSCVLAVQ